LLLQSAECREGRIRIDGRTLRRRGRARVTLGAILTLRTAIIPPAFSAMPLAATVTAITIFARATRCLIGAALATLAIAVTWRTATLIAITAATVAALVCPRGSICGGCLAPGLGGYGRSWSTGPMRLPIVAAVATPIAATVAAAFTTMTAMALTLALLSAIDSAVLSTMAAARAPDLDQIFLGSRGCRLGRGL
jgi:hypothetical protein